MQSRLASIRRISIAIVLLATAMLAMGASAADAGASTVSGTVFYDLNRNGVKDAVEAPLPNQGIYLLDATGQSQLAHTASDASGQYSFSGLADGSYRVVFDTADWWAIRSNW